MGKVAKVVVKEGLKDLKKLRSKVKTAKIQKRVECLIIFKSHPLKTKQAVADHLLVKRKTIHSWLALYKDGGIQGLLDTGSRNKKSKTISAEIHKGLEAKLQDDKDALLGYWQVQLWVKQTYGVDISYHWLRKYVIKYFKCKLKQPRKSHYKKDDEAATAFLKTA